MSYSESSLNREKYMIGLHKPIRLGTSCEFEISDCPNVLVRFNKLRTNVFWPGDTYITAIVCGNIHIMQGTIDAFHYRKRNGSNESIDTRTLNPAERLILRASYNGYIPEKKVPNSIFNLIFEFHGYHVRN